MTIAKVAIAVAVGSCKVTTGIGGLTFQAIIGKLADAAIVQHVAERTIVVSVAGQSSRNEQVVRHDELLRCVEVYVNGPWFDGRNVSHHLSKPSAL